MRSTIILSTSSKQAYKTAGHIWGVRGKGTRGATRAVHRPSRPSPPLADKNPFREWNMWETGPPRGIILNYVCPHLSGRRFHLVALRPFVNLARDPGPRHSSTIPPIRSRRLLRCLMRHAVSRRRFTIRFGSIHASKQLWIVGRGSVSKRW